jgi:predicted ABC-type ATPase
LASADRCIKRVCERKSLGGHFVPEETIRRRYEGGLRNFFELYAPIAENWSFFDNTNKPRRLIASGGIGIEDTVLDTPLSDKMKEEYKHG